MCSFLKGRWPERPGCQRSPRRGSSREATSVCCRGMEAQHGREGPQGHMCQVLWLEQVMGAKIM